MEEFTSEENLHEIYNLIQNTNNKKISRRFPPYKYFENFFHYYIKTGKGKIMITRYQGKIIGGAILGFEKKQYCVLPLLLGGENEKIQNAISYNIHNIFSYENGGRERIQIF